MTTATQPDIVISPTWQNIVALNATLANVDVLVQNLSGCTIQVVSKASGAQPDQTTTGLLLDFSDSVIVNSAQIWVRTSEGPGLISVMVR